MRRVLETALWVGPLILGMVLATLAAERQGRIAAQPSGEGQAGAPERIKIRGLENTFRLSPNLYSGSDPHGVETLRALKKLGVRTIISVDGVTPDVETAKKLGIRYVHLPIGYDGVPRDQAVRMVKAVETLPGPVYVHCHHGIHRGPASAAICGMATEGWSKVQAANWMTQAGTSGDYRGLYASIRDFVPPTAKELDELKGELPERSEVPALVEMMVGVDQRWEILRAVQKAGFQPPASRPDLDPTAEALQLLELFRESARLPESKAKGSDFLKAIASAETLATRLYESMATHQRQAAPDSLNELEASFAAMGKSCKSCHARYRDN